jgi:AGZA family xanthine/uracil permease-like MFS transporter
VVVAGLFALAPFFGPLAALVPSAATGPALIIVGIMMMGQIREIDWRDWAELLPAFTVVLMITFSNEIHTGIAVGFMVYAAVMLLSGRGREVSALVYALAVIFAALFIQRHLMLAGALGG